MSVFLEYENKKGAYQSAQEEFRKAQDSYLNLVKYEIKDNLELTKGISKLNKGILDQDNARKDLENIAIAITEASIISLDTARAVLPNLLRNPEDCDIEVANYDGIDYLVLSTPEVTEPILLGVKLVYNFALYTIDGTPNDFELKGCESYNNPSAELDALSDFIDQFISYKVQGKVSDWQEFYDRFYINGRFSSLDEEKIENITFQAERDAEKHNKRRRSTVIARTRKKRAHQIQAMKKLDKTLKYFEKHQMKKNS